LNDFLDVLDNAKVIKDDFKLYCDGDLRLEEVKECIGNLKDNRSPGNDGLISEFYKVFRDKLVPFLLAVFIESIEKGELPSSLKQGVITLIPKPNKDILYLENWRPISLLNNDAKLFALIFAKRLKKGLENIIDEEQTGFIQVRHISNNIRKILDMVDYNDYVLDDSFILFIDFHKAFDTIEHTFLFKAIDFFGFGNYFQKAIKTLYKGCNSSVKLARGTSGRFEIGRGIRQGCPISPFLFLLATQIMALHIKTGHFQGIAAVGKTFKLCQFADDTALFLKDKNEIIKAVKCIKEFSDVSGLGMNMNKSVLFPLKECSLTNLCNIPIENQVTYLGVVICKNENLHNDLNFNPIINKTSKKLNAWLQRDLSILGRVLLSKAEGISRSVYVSLSLNITSKVTKQLDKMLFDFIWKNKSHYLRKEILCNPKDHGGLEVLSYDALNNVFKINWLIQCLKNKDCIWNSFPNYLFKQLGGLSFLLKCNFSIEKIPFKLARFHKQALMAWTLAYKHNFSPRRYYIWNNKDILYKNKSLFFTTGLKIILYWLVSF